MQVPMEEVISEYQKHLASLTADLMSHRAAVRLLEGKVTELEGKLVEAQQS